MIDPYTYPESNEPVAAPEHTDFASLSRVQLQHADFLPMMDAHADASALPNLRPNKYTDFASLTKGQQRAPLVLTHNTMADYVVDFATPFMIFLMLNAILMYLLNMRFIFTTVHDVNLRVFAFFFVLGVVALNRLIARDGQQESSLYVVGLFMAVALYSVATTEFFGMGSVTRNFMNDNTWWSLLFNLSATIFIWWVANRLTHECCVDENMVAGDIGMLTATAEKFRFAVQKAAERPAVAASPGASAAVDEPWLTISAVDPLEERIVKKIVEKRLDFSDRLPRRHPGMAVFFFSVPIVLLFAAGMLVIQSAGMPALRMGAYYLYMYLFCAMFLLSLTCLRQLRAYFGVRLVAMPRQLPWFWVCVSLLTIMLIMWSAAMLPMPSFPKAALEESHPVHAFNPISLRSDQLGFRPMSMVLLERTYFMERVDLAARIAVVLLIVFGAAKVLQYAVGLALLNKQRMPSMLSMLITALAWLLFHLWPSLFKWTFPKRRLRIQRHVAMSSRYDNPLSNPELAASMSVREHVVYAYEALRALAADVGAPPKSSQTPYEFLESYPPLLKSMREEAEILVRLYVVAAYSDSEMDARIEDQLRRFWHAFRVCRNHFVY